MLSIMHGADLTNVALLAVKITANDSKTSEDLRDVES